MKKPMIGVIPLVDEKRESYWMLPGYLRGIEQAGGIPLMLPLTAEEDILARLAECLDGFLFTGGHDVSPQIYGEEKRRYCGDCCEERDRMELVLLKEILRLDRPLLGICRGIQLLNAALGGNLYQDLPEEHPSPVEHHQAPPYDQPVHRVCISEDSPLYFLLGKKELSVNSYHHQAVRILSPRLEEMAVSEDGLTEAVYMPDQTFVWAVQWHPEFSFESDGDSRKIFEAFVNAAKSSGKKKEACAADIFGL